MPTPTRIKITSTNYILKSDLKESFLLASGPGGQNVNKVSTAVQLKYDVLKSHTLTQKLTQRLKAIAGSKLTSSGVLIITARRYRSQEKNRKEALDRLIDLITQASIEPKLRRVKKVKKSAIRKRLDNKKKRAEKKTQRQKVDF